MPIIISKNLIKYISFVMMCFLVIWVFITATNFIQLAAGILIYPLLILFAYKIFSNGKRIYSPKKTVNTISAFIKTAEKEKEAIKPGIGISDIDKRVFLKLIGGTGIALFLFSLFNRRPEEVLFKNLPAQDKISLTDSEGRKISPAQNQPLDGFKIAEIEDSAISFYGFVNKDDAWYILRVDIASGSFRYAKGERDFPGSWKGRENLGYDYFNNVFKQ